MLTGSSGGGGERRKGDMVKGRFMQMAGSDHEPLNWEAAYGSKDLTKTDYEKA